MVEIHREDFSAESNYGTTGFGMGWASGPGDDPTNTTVHDGRGSAAGRNSINTTLRQSMYYHGQSWYFYETYDHWFADVVSSDDPMVVYL